MKSKTEINWLGILSIITSLVALGFSLLFIEPYHISTEAYIGIIATFVGICTTFIVGYQIYNSIEMNKRINRLEKLEERFINIEHVDLKTEGNLEIAKGFFYKGYQDDIGAFHCFHMALYYFLQSDISKVDEMLTNMDNLLNANVSKFNFEEKEKIAFLADKIKALEDFSKYATKYNKIMKILKIDKMYEYGNK